MTNATDLQTDVDWEDFARTDPYWAVLTCDQYRSGNLDADARAAFFESGAEHIGWVEVTLRTYFDPGFAPRRALDFGCGVGRLLLPLARRCAEVVGVDVSDTMLREAEANCRAAAVENVALVKGDDELSGVTGAFDFVHTMMVLQHIPTARGVRIFRRLVELVAPGGCGAIHVTYGPPVDRTNRGPLRAIAGALVRPFRRRSREMQMNRYPLHELFQIAHKAGVPHLHAVFMNHAGPAGILLLFRKDDRPSPHAAQVRPLSLTEHMSGSTGRS